VRFQHSEVAMHRLRLGPLDLVLTLVGFAAWLIYILACGPSFSPDDTKILYPSIDPKTGATALALYDRAAGTSRALLVPPLDRGKSGSRSERHEGMALATTWTPDGARAVALWAESDDVLRVAVVPVAGASPVRLLRIDDLGDAAFDVIVGGPAIHGGHLFVSKDEEVRRIDMETGESASKDVGGETVVVTARDRLHYYRELETKEGQPERWEFGQMDPETFALTPAFTSDVKAEHFWVVSDDGARIVAESESPCTMAIIAGGKVERRLEIGTDGNGVVCGRPVWSRDGATLYAPYRRRAKEGQVEYGVMEVPVSGGAPRYTPLFGATGTGDINDMTIFQIALSHDQKTVAAPSTFIALNSDQGKVKPDDVALFLVDLSRADRRVTRVAIPAPMGPARDISTK
jgi:hypothetical protein